jgi:glutamate dehydrogenase/leucine dehydrogenase
MSSRGDALLRSLSWEHERVHLIQDADTGLRGVIAIHSTALGPALGGLRVRRYEHGMPEALDDVLRLSHAMTLKASAAGLELGGGKAVMIDDGRSDLRSSRLIAMAREIERLGGQYITAEDIGTSTTDMDLIAEHTHHVVGCTAHDGVGGDPSPDTARTVLGAIRAALETLYGADELAGRSIGVVGLGKVGGPLARWLVAAGAQVVGFDPVQAVAQPARAAGVEVVESAQAVFARNLDVLAPCAIGGMIDTNAAERLRCAIICGSANNPLADEQTERALAASGILYVPDFLANCGGLIHVDAERRGDANAAHLQRALDGAATRTREVLIEARTRQRLPGQVAVEHAWKRISRAGARSFSGAAA